MSKIVLKIVFKCTENHNLKNSRNFRVLGEKNLYYNVYVHNNFTQIKCI